MLRFQSTSVLVTVQTDREICQLSASIPSCPIRIFFSNHKTPTYRTKKQTLDVYHVHLLKKISKTVWILSFVSFFTDLASEMLYPVMPIYLKEIGFSILLIGVLEGVAEAVAGLSKGYFGKLSDHMGKRLPFVKTGYALSAISKPMLALFTYPLWIFLARTTDRIGKGIRTGARDALLSDEATPETKGRVFGLHRSMDTLGAVGGPLLAIWFLSINPQQYATLFYLAFIPGVLAVVSLFILREKPRKKAVSFEKINLFSFLKYWKKAHRPTEN